MFATALGSIAFAAEAAATVCSAASYASLTVNACAGERFCRSSASESIRDYWLTRPRTCGHAYKYTNYVLIYLPYLTNRSDRSAGAEIYRRLDQSANCRSVNNFVAHLPRGLHCQLYRSDQRLWFRPRFCIWSIDVEDVHEAYGYQCCEHMLPIVTRLLRLRLPSRVLCREGHLP